MTVVFINIIKTLGSNRQRSRHLTQIGFGKTPVLHGADEQATFVYYKPMNTVCDQLDLPASIGEPIQPGGVRIAVPYIISKSKY